MTIYAPENNCIPCPKPCPIVGPPGPMGPRGPRGHRGPMGPQGPAAPVVPQVYGSYYALAPADNPNPITAGQAVAFPSVASSDGVVQTSPTTFNLVEPGTYNVNYRINSSTAGQLQVALNGAGVAYTTTGINAGNDVISGNTMITTTAPNTLLSIINPATNTTSVTVAQNAGGTVPTASQLNITKID